MPTVVALVPPCGCSGTPWRQLVQIIWQTFPAAPGAGFQHHLQRPKMAEGTISSPQRIRALLVRKSSCPGIRQTLSFKEKVHSSSAIGLRLLGLLGWFPPTPPPRLFWEAHCTSWPSCLLCSSSDQLFPFNKSYSSVPLHCS